MTVNARKPGNPTVVIFFLALMSIFSSAYAHKVNIFAYSERGRVYTESYFPDGRRVKDGIIEVYDGKENKLLEGKTDENGRFDFVTPVRDNLKIVLIASLGHRNLCRLSAEELSVVPDAESGEETDSSFARKAVKTNDKRISFIKVVAGIGCVFGIAGIASYLLGRKKRGG